VPASKKNCFCAEANVSEEEGITRGGKRRGGKQKEGEGWVRRKKIATCFVGQGRWRPHDKPNLSKAGRLRKAERPDKGPCRLGFARDRIFPESKEIITKAQGKLNGRKKQNKGSAYMEPGQKGQGKGKGVEKKQ